jgi:DegV family protein with EDD domain
MIAAADYENVYVVDSGSAAMGSGILVEMALQLAEEGLSAQEIAARLEEEKQKIVIVALVDTLEYLKKGGRCSSVAAIAANVLKIHPSIFMKDGKLGVRKKYMGSLKRCISSYVDDLAEEYPDYVDTRVFITHSCCTDEIVEHIKQKVQEKFAFNEICVTVAGPVITSHCGQGTLGVLFIKK